MKSRQASKKKGLENLRPEEFDTHVRNNTLRLAFVGMSNVGKSFRARTLQSAGFFWYQVDDEIQKELQFSDMSELSSWLGYPNSSTYAERERRYLELEAKYTKAAATKVYDQNLIFDTTGSVIHLDQGTLEALREHTLLVHLEADETQKEALIEKFFKEPKPVAWSGYFTIRKEESVDQALRRSYPNLLHARLKKYRDLAHLTIPAAAFYDTDAKTTLSIIRTHLANI
ncbi:MAG: hypothetical protein RIQ56_385 [Candidatus Parcubacteria bacterium]|jgi:shikimate kinase